MPVLGMTVPMLGTGSNSIYKTTKSNKKIKEIFCRHLELLFRPCLGSVFFGGWVGGGGVRGGGSKLLKIGSDYLP